MDLLKNSSGGYLRIFVNNTNDVESNNGSNGTEAVAFESDVIRVGGTHKITFGNTYRESIIFYGSQYTMGSQTNGVYSRIASGGRFSWYEGGVHSNTEGNAGTNGTVLMTLVNAGLGLNCIPAHRLDVDGNINCRGFYRGSIQRGNNGSISILGSNNGFAGIDFNSASATFMIKNTDQQCGLYKNDSTWIWRFDTNGALTDGSIPWARLTSIPTNAVGSRTISSANPNGGSDGDIWYKI